MRYSKPSFCIAVLTLFVTGKSLSQVQIETKIGLSIAGMHWVDGGEKVNIKTASGIWVLISTRQILAVVSYLDTNLDI